MDVSTEIAGILGFDLGNHLLADRIRSIKNKLTKNPGEEGFEAEVLAVAEAVKAQGVAAFSSLIGAISSAMEPKEREYKIKRSLKGQRIKIVSESGVKFSFGPVWCDSVRACKGIALNENNREKLNMHGVHLGVKDPENLTARELCSAISTLM